MSTGGAATRETRELELKLEEERKRHEQAAAEDARRREIERRVEAERAERAAEQEAVVSALAEGLKRLSSGDLAARIETLFERAVEEIRALGPLAWPRPVDSAVDEDAAIERIVQEHTAAMEVPA